MEGTDNTLANRKRTIRSYQLKVQTIHWPNEKGQLEVSIEGTDNTLANRKRTIRSYQLKVQTIHWPKEKGQLEAIN